MEAIQTTVKHTLNNVQVEEGITISLDVEVLFKHSVFLSQASEVFFDIETRQLSVYVTEDHTFTYERFIPTISIKLN